MDDAFSTFLLLSCAAYFYLAVGRVYGVRRIGTVVLVAASAAIFIGYRFAMLLITLYTT